MACSALCDCGCSIWGIELGWPGIAQDVRGLALDVRCLIHRFLGRFFANKLWNAGRFLLGNLKEMSPADREALAVSGPMSALEVKCGMTH